MVRYCDDRVCVFVCPPDYLRNGTFDLYQNFLWMLLMAVAQSSGRVMRSQGEGMIFGCEGWDCTLRAKSDIYDCLAITCTCYC